MFHSALLMVAKIRRRSDDARATTPLYKQLPCHYYKAMILFIILTIQSENRRRGAKIFTKINGTGKKVRKIFAHKFGYRKNRSGRFCKITMYDPGGKSSRGLFGETGDSSITSVMDIEIQLHPALDSSANVSRHVLNIASTFPAGAQKVCTWAVAVLFFFKSWRCRCPFHSKSRLQP